MARIPSGALSHLIYAFLRFDQNNKLATRTEDTLFPSTYAAMVQVQQRSPGLRLIAGIGGGGSYSDYFPTATASESSREVAAQSIVDFFGTHPGLDGVDLDWESPANPTQRSQLTAFVTKLRAKLDGLSTTTGKRYSISLATTSIVDCGNVPSICIDAQLDTTAVTPLIDFYNVMTYSMTGSWTGNTQHHAALVARPDVDHFASQQSPGFANSGVNAVAAYRARGVPANKLNLGVPFYGVQFCGVPAGTTNGLFQTFNPGLSDPAGCAGEAQINYRDIITRYTAAAGWQDNLDVIAKGSWLFNAAQGKLISYESPASLAAKRDWANQNGVGLMIWDLGADTDAWTLLSVIKS